MNLKQHMKKDKDEGFTLIELLVVVLILGILMAIAIPTFLSLTGGAKTSAAESDLTTAVQDEASYLTSNGVFDANTGTLTAGFTAANQTSFDNAGFMKTADSGLNWTPALVPPAASAGTKTVSIDVINNTSATPIVVLGTLASDGNMYWIQDSGGTLLYAETKTIAAQPAAADFAATNTSWKGMSATAVPYSA